MIALALSGCAAPRLASQAELQSLLEDLNQAIVARDEPAIQHAFAELPSGSAELLTRNISQLTQVEFGTAQHSGWVRWNAAAGPSAWHEIDASADCRGSRCALTKLAAKPGQPAPLWLVSSVYVSGSGKTTVICSQIDGCDDFGTWLGAARSAVDATLPSELRGAWDGSLVLQVPADSGSFSAVIGAPSSELAGIAALTMSLDTGRTAAADQGLTTIVTNPKVFSSLAGADQKFVLTHETVHVATAFLGQPPEGWLWVSEGIAEQVAIAAHRQYERQARDRLTAACPLAHQPPSDAELLQTSNLADLQLAYARAWAAIGQVPASQWLASWQGTAPSLDLSWPCD